MTSTEYNPRITYFGFPGVRRFGEETIKELVIAEVTRHYGVTWQQICGPSKKAVIVMARWIIAYALRVRTSMTNEKIGELLGGRDHSTITHAVQMCQCRIEQEEEVAAFVNTVIVKQF
jgi:chromosomal replication initiator protein